ncbi:hypothetical protein QYM36_001385 [Artemia franciscana]|uniref:Uncharacterized protein n=2 Tax=Artemia franciscana TaxID=6661 RepID=A0AA88LFL2_ARTSF|nr:hypothetical protein QYM36_001385 [Artemia franciscana]
MGILIGSLNTTMKQFKTVSIEKNLTNSFLNIGAAIVSFCLHPRRLDWLKDKALLDQMEGNMKLNICKQLLKIGANPNVKDGDVNLLNLKSAELRPLHYATIKGKLDICQLLLSYKADPNMKDGFGRRAPLHYATEKSEPAICKLLLSYGADPNIKEGTNGNTPLQIAAVNGFFKICQLLLNNGADLNYIQGDGPKTTALQNAILKGKFDICHLLLSHGADPNVKGGVHKATSLHFAAEKGRLDICHLLLKNGADPNVKTLSNKTALHYAIFTGKLDICQLLLRYGANPNANGGSYNKTPLQFAAEKGSLDICQLLLRIGADPNLKSTFFNKTALHFAAEKSQLGICQLLLSNRADPNAICKIKYTKNGRKNVKRKTALLIALQNRSFKEYFPIAKCFFEIETDYHSKLPVDVKKEYKTIIVQIIKYSNTPGLPPKEKWFWRMLKIAFNDTDGSLKSMCEYLIREFLDCDDIIDEIKRMNIPEILKPSLIFRYLPEPPTHPGFSGKKKPSKKRTMSNSS